MDFTLNQLAVMANALDREIGRINGLIREANIRDESVGGATDSTNRLNAARDEMRDARNRLDAEIERRTAAGEVRS
jgi:hypothetical protein